MQTAKQDVEHLLHQLPDDSTLEDIQYHLYVLEKIKRGQQAIADGKRYTSEEARERLRTTFETNEAGPFVGAVKRFAVWP